MVGIKDFEMPVSCSRCELICEDMYGDAMCVLLGLGSEITDYTKEHRDENCPLVEIDEVKA